MTDSLQSFYQTVHSFYKRSAGELYPVQEADESKQGEFVFISHQTSISQEVAEKVELLRTDEYFDTFLKLFNFPIPSLNDPAIDHLQHMRSWASSLRKPMALYIATERAKAVGLTPLQLKILLRNKTPIPEFVDHSAFQRALNAQSALCIFNQELLRIGRKVPSTCSFTTSIPSDPDEEEEGVLDSLTALSLGQAPRGKPLSLKPPESKKANKEGEAESTSKPLPISLVPGGTLGIRGIGVHSEKKPQQKKIKVF